MILRICRLDAFKMTKKIANINKFLPKTFFPKNQDSSALYKFQTLPVFNVPVKLKFQKLKSGFQLEQTK